MKTFFVDEKRKLKKSYDELIEDLNNKDTFQKINSQMDPYSIFLEITFSMAMGIHIDIEDTDNQKNNCGAVTAHSKKLDVNDYDDLLYQIDKNKESWGFTIYTSGTTGKPKKVSHSFETAARNLKKSDKYKDDVWAFAYNPTHFAGLQVFFQAFFNMNEIVYIFDTDKNKLNELLIAYEVSSISATPTFYRTMLPSMSEPVFSVRHVTFGGEKFDPVMKQKIMLFFPKAKIRNIYALTEAGSLFNAVGEAFFISEEQKAFIKVTEDNELLIGKNLLACMEDYRLVDGWYHTGDIVEFIDKDRFRFVSRKSEMINIGGYKVNPVEIEEEILKTGVVSDVLASGRKNSVTGNIVIAQVVKNDGLTEEEAEKFIYAALAERLPKWKIPGRIIFCTELPKTRTGKKARL